MPELKQERTFKRFGASEDGSRWDLTDVVDEHSEHIEQLEADLRDAKFSMIWILNILERMTKPEDHC